LPEDAERQAWLASLDIEPPRHAERPKHEGYRDACPACKLLPDNLHTLDVHLANGGQDPWQDIPP